MDNFISEDDPNFEKVYDGAKLKGIEKEFGYIIHLLDDIDLSTAKNRESNGELELTNIMAKRAGYMDSTVRYGAIEDGFEHDYKRRLRFYLKQNSEANEADFLRYQIFTLQEEVQSGRIRYSNGDLEVLDELRLKLQKIQGSDLIPSVNVKLGPTDKIRLLELTGVLDHLKKQYPPSKVSENTIAKLLANVMGENEGTIQGLLSKVWSVAFDSVVMGNESKVKAARNQLVTSVLNPVK
jgi:hypothetical protein